MTLKTGKLNDRSVNMFVRVIFCATLIVGDVCPAIVASAFALDSYVSWPKPAAIPNSMRLLLATIRQAPVFSVRSEMWKVELLDVPVIDKTGRSRRRYVNAMPGTTSDSCRALMRNPYPNFSGL